MNPDDDDRSPKPNAAERESGPGEPHPDTPETMQHDHEDAPGRQRYADARPGDYSKDFQSDGSGTHPVKPPSEDGVDEDGVPKIAATEPPGKRPADADD